MKRQDRRVVPSVVNVRRLPYVVLDSMCHQPANRVMSRPALTRRTPAVGDCGGTAAASRLLPLALFALMVPSYLLKGYSAPAFGTRLRGLRWKRAIGCSPSWRSVTTSGSGSSPAGCTSLIGSATFPHKGYWSPTG
jgi:hypothetical protein